MYNFAKLLETSPQQPPRVEIRQLFSDNSPAAKLILAENDFLPIMNKKYRLVKIQPPDEKLRLHVWLEFEKKPTETKEPAMPIPASH